MKATDDRIEIGVSKTKVFFLLLGAIAFVLLCIWILFFYESDIIEKGVAVAGILFFGLGIFIFAKKLFDNSMGFIIDKYGVTDNVTNPKVGTIEWQDIQRVEVISYMGTKMLLIYVWNPEKYLDRIEPSKRTGLNNNYRLVGTPFAFPSSILKIKLEGLSNLINERLLRIE